MKAHAHGLRERTLLKSQNPTLGINQTIQLTLINTLKHFNPKFVH